MKKTLLFALTVLLLASCEKPENGDENGNENNTSNPHIIKDAVKDIDGNQYDVVKIGNQVWMAENLKTTRYADGTSIPLDSVVSCTEPYRYCPDGDNNNVDMYGYLYNWKAVMRDASSSSDNPSGVQGICPQGWHVPSDAEWTQLEDYVRSQSQYRCNDDEYNIAKALASTTGWNLSSIDCAVGNVPSSNNDAGFSAVPAGNYDGRYGHFGCNAYFWSATQLNSNYAYYRALYYNDAYVDCYYFGKEYGYSVRCLSD